MIPNSQSVAAKQRARIITVDPSTRRIEAGIKDGVIQVSVMETGPLFRWPLQGELWTVTRYNNYWQLGQLLEEGEQGKPIEDVGAGEIKISADIIHTLSGHQVLTSADQGSLLPKLESAPDDPGEGYQYYDLTLHAVRTWNGTIWI